MLIILNFAKKKIINVPIKNKKIDDYSVKIYSTSRDR